MYRAIFRIYSKIVIFVSAIVLSTSTELYQNLTLDESLKVCDREYISGISTKSKICDILATNKNEMAAEGAKNSNLTKS